MALLAARCKAVRRIQASEPQRTEADIISKLVAYTSDQVRAKAQRMETSLVNANCHSPESHPGKTSIHC